MFMRDEELVEILVRYTAIGAFGGMAMIGGLMYFDVSNIGTLAIVSTAGATLSTLVIGGAFLKGGTIGFAVGLARLSTRRQVAKSGIAPLSATNPAPS